MKQNELDIIEKKFLSVIGSCKNSEHFDQVQQWIKNVYRSNSYKMTLSQKLWCGDWVKIEIKRQKEYLQRIENIGSLEVNLENYE